MRNDPVSNRSVARYLRTAAPENRITGVNDMESAASDLWWWHTIDLPGGFRTPGHQRIEEQEFIAHNIPKVLSGKTVLDIGAADGYFSFLAEKRNAAKVLAIDVFQGYKPEE